MDIIICEPVIYRSKGEIVKVAFRRLEIRVQNKDYMLTSYESESFDLDTVTFEILNGDRKFSFMNGKEIVVTVKELCEHGNNAQILVGKIERCIRKINQTSVVSEKEMNIMMVEIQQMHSNHTEQAVKNLIDLALETNDKELFVRMCRMEVPECK